MTKEQFVTAVKERQIRRKYAQSEIIRYNPDKQYKRLREKKRRMYA